MPVSVLLGNIFDGGTDLTVLPCSAKPSVSKFMRNWIEMFNLADPLKFKYDLVHGGTSHLYNFRHRSKKTKHYIYGAAVLNDDATPESVFKIALKVGQITAENPKIRNVETVLLGTGAGGLSNIESVVGLAAGFEESAHPDARLIIYASNAGVKADIEKELSNSKLEKLAERIKFAPALFGIGIDLNEPKMKVAKALSRIKVPSKR